VIQPAKPRSVSPVSERMTVDDPADSVARRDRDDDHVLLLTRLAVAEGSVVSLDPERPGYVVPSSRPGDALIVGCAVAADDPVSGQLGVATGRIALCRVDASIASVAVGDRLVASPMPGHAMKDDGSLPGATVLGRAIDPLPSGTGLIRVLVAIR